MAHQHPAPIRMSTSYYHQLKSKPGFTVIFPVAEDKYKEYGVEIGSLVSLKTYTDQDYEKIKKGNKKVMDHPKREYFCSVEVIKSCRLENLARSDLDKALRFSWDLCPQFESFHDYIVENSSNLLDLVLNIYYIEFPHYNLKTLSLYFEDGQNPRQLPN